MFNIFDKNVVNIPRGDSVTVYVTPIDDSTGNPIVLEENDSVIFAVATKTGEPVLSKTLTSANYDDSQEGSLVCEFAPEDTANLPTGEYPYTCLLVLSAGTRVTFVTSSIVITETIAAEVTGGE